MRRLILLAAATAAFAAFPLAAPAAPAGELAYAEGQTYTMIGATLVTNASPGMLAAPPMYVLVYPAPAGTSGPITLPSGYQPQCNPCLQEPFAYHDHLLTGAPGVGDYEAPWRIVVMVYNPKVAFSPTFEPVTSDDDLVKAENAGDFLPINPGGANRYQIWTPNVLICPIVMQNGR
jgi:hypothetical protein